MRRRRPAFWVSLAVIALFAMGTAESGPLWDYCHFNSVPGGVATNFFQPGATVDIYHSTHTTGASGSTTDLRPWIAAGITEQDFATALIKAVGVWNEQSGAKIRLRYEGALDATDTSCDQSHGDICKILVIGNSANNLTCTQDNADSNPRIVSGVYTGGTLSVNQYNNHIAPCSLINWYTTTAGYYTDLPRALIHELGHMVFDLGHPNGPKGSRCSGSDADGYPILSVMNTGVLSDARNLKAWDKELAQGRYGTRSVGATMLTTVMNGTASWQTAVSAGSGLNPLYRPGSVSQETLNQMPIAWQSRSSPSPNSYGFGFLTNSAFASSTYSLGSLTTRIPSSPYFSVASTVAVAAQDRTYTNPVTMMAYKAANGGTGTNSSHGYDTDMDNICYALSSDYGSTFGSQSCTTQASGVFGISAAFSDGGSAFVVPFSETYVSGSQVFYSLDFLVVGANGALPHVTRDTGIATPTAPTIACKKNSTECLVVFAGDDSLGGLCWMFVTIDPATHVVNYPGSFYETGYIVDNSPSLTYDSFSALYRMAKPEKASAIYSYSIPSGGTSWTATGDIYNNLGGTTQISGAAIGIDVKPSGVFSVSFEKRAWFVKSF